MSQDDKRNNIIIAEIQYWKKSKLLPEEYCDFLLALYTKGDGSAYEEMQYSRRITIRLWLQLISLILIVPIILLIGFNFNTVVTLIFSIIFGSLAFILHNSLKKNHSFLMHFSLIIFLFIILLITLSLSQFLFDSQQATNIIMIINFISWLIYGYKYKFTYLIILGILANLFTLFYMVL